MSSLLRSPALAMLPGIGHGFETRAGRLPEAGPRQIARLRQVHGNQVHVLDEGTDLRPYLRDAVEERPPGDALVTALPGLAVAVATADCAPILIADPQRRLVGAVHAGWRGVAAGVIEATLAAMRDRFGCDAGDCVAAVGPCVGAARYEVGAEVRDAFAGRGLSDSLFEPTRPGHWRCDLGGAVRQQLRLVGVPTVDMLNRCTASEPQEFHSWRRDGAAAGRMLAGIFVMPGQL